MGRELGRWGKKCGCPVRTGPWSYSPAAAAVGFLYGLARTWPILSPALCLQMLGDRGGECGRSLHEAQRLSLQLASALQQISKAFVFSSLLCLSLGAGSGRFNELIE